MARLLPPIAIEFAKTDWTRIVGLYERLCFEAPSPVIEIGHAMAPTELRGVAAGRAALRALEVAQRLARYPFYWAARAELELRIDNAPNARDFYVQARSLARNDAERGALDRRLALLD